MIPTATLGFSHHSPTFKAILSNFASGTVHLETLEKAAHRLRLDNWRLAMSYGVRHIASNDFTWMDRLRDTMSMLGILPEGLALSGSPLSAKKQLESMADVSYPKLSTSQRFAFGDKRVVHEFIEARDHGILTRPIILGPVSFLAAAGGPGALSHISQLLPVYVEIMTSLMQKGCEWLQVDEPSLDAEADPTLVQLLFQTYTRLAELNPELKIMLVPGEGALKSNLIAALELPVAGIHLDLSHGFNDLIQTLEVIPKGKTLSLGIAGQDTPEALPMARQLIGHAFDRCDGRLQLTPTRKATLALEGARAREILDSLQQWSRQDLQVATL